MECIFCKIYKERKGIIFENKYFYAKFDSFPVSPGHAEVIPIRHVVSLLELNEDEWIYLKPAIENVIKIIESTDFKKLYEDLVKNPINEKSKWFYEQMLKLKFINKKPDGYNIGINEGRAAGRTVDHLHIHIIPRFFGDVEDPTGGVRNVIPKLANYKI